MPLSKVAPANLKCVYAPPFKKHKHLEHVISGEEAIKQVKKISSDVVVLKFSRGKDSLGAWLSLHGKFKTIIPIFMYRVPDIEFIKRSIDYFESAFKTRVYQLPHPWLYRMLIYHTLQPPDRLAIIDAAKLPMPSQETLVRMHVEDLGYDPQKVWSATGVRAGDSVVRINAIRRYGPITHKTHLFHPIWDWHIDYMLSRVKDAGLKLAEDYKLFGRSFDGINYQFLEPIKDHHPKDYETILRWFPLAGVEAFRRTLGEHKEEVKKAK